MDTEFTLWTLWLLLTISLLCFLNAARSRSSGADRLPPGPIPLPVIGNLLKLGPNPHLSLARLAATYGPVMTLKLGAITTIVVTSPDAAREILQKKDQVFSGRGVRDTVRALHHNEVSIAWLPANQRWRKLRKLCNTHLFTSQRLNASQGIRQAKVRELIAYIRDACAEGRPLDIGRAAFGMIINLVSNTLFSADVVNLNDKSSQEFKDLMWEFMEEVGAVNLSDFFPLLGAIDLQGRRRRVEGHFKRLHAIFERVIERRLSERAKGSVAGGADFLDALLDWEIEENNPELNRHAMKCLLADLFFGGSDTTSTTVEWAMAELLRNPRSMEKARAELAEVVGRGKDVDESDTSRLPYIQAVVKETLRLHPAAPLLLPHEAETSMELCGYAVPKGTQVLVNVWAIARDKGIWEDPDEFRPERFLASSVDYRGQDFELIPFSAGRRLCPGLPLASRMLHLILASLIHSFDWKLPNGMEPSSVDMSGKFGITLAMAVPLQVIAVPVA